MTTVQDINKQLRERYPIGCRVQFYRTGAHLARLKLAPTRVKLVGC